METNGCGHVHGFSGQRTIETISHPAKNQQMPQPISTKSYSQVSPPWNLKDVSTQQMGQRIWRWKFRPSLPGIFLPDMKVFLKVGSCKTMMFFNTWDRANDINDPKNLEVKDDLRGRRIYSLHVSYVLL